MATRAHITMDTIPRRVLAALGEAPRRRRTTFAAQVMTPALRSAIHHEARQLLDAATFLIDFLNAADAPAEDMEPDHDGEGEPGEASLQPITLSPPVRPVQVIRPSRAQMRAAYRANGDRIPDELRGLIGRAFA